MRLWWSRARGGSTIHSMNRDHAVVIGGSVAGLCAARSLARVFQRVTLVERDPFPDAPEVRKGTPQAHHVHVMLARGADILEGLFPGLDAELAAAGAVQLEIGGDVGYLTLHGWSLPFQPTIPMRATSRALLEHCLRRRVMATERVTALAGREVAGLLHSPRGVSGVLLGGGPGSGQERLEADLVVDASGRGSRAPAWLKEMGRTPPEETLVDAYVGYSTRIYDGPPALPGNWRSVFVGWTQQLTRGGVILPLEGGRTIATLVGAAKDYPPLDEAGFLAYARSLRAPHVYDAIAGAKPLSEIRGTRSTANRWLHYERLSDQPAGFVASGDAACAFNPVYGQGMTVAAMGATLLAEMVEQPMPAEQLPRQFQRQMAKQLRPVWNMATTEDFRFPGTLGKISPTTKLGHRYIDALLKLTLDDADLARNVVRVFQLLDPPGNLVRPALAARVLAHALLG